MILDVLIINMLTFNGDSKNTHTAYRGIRTVAPRDGATVFPADAGNYTEKDNLQLCMHAYS